MWNVICILQEKLKEPGPIASDFFKLSMILSSEESSYLSRYTS